MSYLLILLAFTQFLLSCKPSLSPFRELNEDLQSKSNFIRKTSRDCAKGCSSPHCCCSDCNRTLSNPKRIINPYRELFTSKVPPRPFGNFCVKCAACLAVASEIQNVIEEENEEYETDLTVKTRLFHDVKGGIMALCRNGFKNFDLRLYGNHGVFTNNFICTSHIVTAAQENWTKRLRQICSLYASRTDLETIVLSVLDSVTNLTETFCRGTGIFRDCINIKSHENITMPPCAPRKLI
ncbi:uncharacterized protein [Euwallacea similis]|uniref:uncharacterized protein n=1 Tax=Euwallacea similis TaxID=1736056 RepID=UPI00344E1BEF